jgi:uncharacterized RDD family membrane protein YckC
MPSADEFRSRYARADDAELQELLSAGAGQLMPEAWAALTAESDRRGLSAAIQQDADDASMPLGEVHVRANRVTYPRAPLGARAIAYLLDMLICSVPVFLAAVPFWIGVASGLSSFVTALPVLAAVIWGIYYGLNKDGRRGGQSIGKAKVGLMVVSIESNRPCSAGESAVRAITLAIANVIPFVGWLIEPITVLATNDGRRIGDRFAGTQVIAVYSYRPTV